MFEIKGNDIYISRGEAAALNVTVYSDGVPWPLDPQEQLLLRVYTLCDDSTILELKSEQGLTAFNIKGEHTKNMGNLPMGYTVKLLFADGTEATIIGQTPTYTPRFYVLEA